MFNLMLDYALEYELVDKNYSRTFELSDDIIKEKEEAKRHIIFQDSEMQTLWENVGKIRFVDWVLIQCYMGWRPQELAILELEDVHLEERYIVGGMKTQAGRHRMVPIHPKIFDLVKKNYDYALELGSHRLFNDPDFQRAAWQSPTTNMPAVFDKVIAALKLRDDHRPHDPRMTFITMAKKAEVDEYTIKNLSVTELPT